MSATVVVDLNVNTGASGIINVFSQAQATITNKVISSVAINSALLTGLIEFQGQDDNIVARLVTGFTTVSANKSALATAIQTSLTTGNLNASEANPFNTVVATVARYSAAGHKNYSTFGELALASYAHFLFGHVDATAAIDNDTTFISKMNGTNEGNGEANLGSKLADLIFGLSGSQCTAIAKQVLGQDASRATNVDNDITTPDAHQVLAFRPDDKIYVSITLNAPTVSVLDAAAQQSEPASSLFVTPIKYMIEATLSGSPGVFD